jgi:hypothetical protein
LPAGWYERASTRERYVTTIPYPCCASTDRILVYCSWLLYRHFQGLSWQRLRDRIRHGPSIDLSRFCHWARSSSTGSIWTDARSDFRWYCTRGVYCFDGLYPSWIHGILYGAHARERVVSMLTGGIAGHPARCFGAMVGSHFSSYHWIHWVGPIVASIVHGLLYHLIPPYSRE